MALLLLLKFGVEFLPFSAALVLFIRIRFWRWPPPPNLEFPSKDCPSATRSRLEILTKESLLLAKTAPTSFQDFHSLVFFLGQAQKVKSADLGFGGGKMILRKDLGKISILYLQLRGTVCRNIGANTIGTNIGEIQDLRFKFCVLSWNFVQTQPRCSPLHARMQGTYLQTVCPRVAWNETLFNRRMMLETWRPGYGGSNLRKLEGGVKILIFGGSLNLTSFYRDSIENPQFGGLSGLPNANAKSPRFSYAISQIAPLPPMVALNRSFKSQIAAGYAAFWHAISQIALASFL